jgi:hypothetical protein
VPKKPKKCRRCRKPIEPRRLHNATTLYCAPCFWKVRDRQRALPGKER